MHSFDKKQEILDSIRNVENQLHKLKTVEPLLLDATLRENAVGSAVGQTLAQKIAIHDLLKSFGLKHFIVGALNYAYPDRTQVDDDFIEHLYTQGADMSDCYCFTDVGTMREASFIPDVSQLKMLSCGIPNTIHEVYLSKERIAGDLQNTLTSIERSVTWLNQEVFKSLKVKPKVYINIVDGCDAFSNNLDFTIAVIKKLANLAVTGLSIEDDRGTYLPVQTTAFVKLAKSLLRPDQKLLVHFHGSLGMENAATLEALGNGADGAWGGFSKGGGVSGHASLSELLGNLYRIGNQHVNTTYQFSRLLPVLMQVEALSGLSAADSPSFGLDSFQLNLSYFEQKQTRPQDLPPSVLGGEYRYKICTVMSDINIIERKLMELRIVDEPVSKAVLETMIYIMRNRLRAGLQRNYNQYQNLLELYQEANSQPM